jgi:hypothetical protein
MTPCRGRECRIAASRGRIGMREPTLMTPGRPRLIVAETDAGRRERAS